MLRYLTAGESHGQALVAVLEGMPAGVPLTSKEIAAELARRRLGYGRGKRMRFEEDRVEVLGGLRHGRTLGSPLAVMVANTEWPKWTEVMSADPVDDPEALANGRGAPLTRPRPGHADLTGMQKYGFDDTRPVLERASARETAARVAAATAAKKLLAELGIYVHWDRKLDARLAAALMSIQAIKGVEIGEGFAGAAKPGSRAHDAILPGAAGRPRRRTGRSGGIEGGMSTGETLRVRAAMKPLSTLVRALDTVDVRSGGKAPANLQRSDVTAVPAAAVVGEAVVALVLADALLEKTGGDSLGEVRRNLDAYLAARGAGPEA